MEALRVGGRNGTSMLYLQFAMACRFSEVSALRGHDVDWTKEIIRIPEGQLAHHRVHGERSTIDAETRSFDR